jgi:hypothetical protein
MKLLTRLLVLICLLVIGICVASADPADEWINPEDTLMQYVNLLNEKDYQSAYNIFHAQNQSYEDFVAGYANTKRIVPYFGFQGVAAGTTYVTTVLLGFQTDGTVESYYGVYRVVSGQMYDPILNNGNWVITGAEFMLVRDGEALHNASIQSLISSAFDRNSVIPSNISHVSAMSSLSATGLLNYYDLINQGDYATAYTRWLAPSNGLTKDYRLPYQQFVAGYGDTAAVMVYLGDEQFVTNVAYMRSFVPAVLVSEHTDGTITTYAGCYAMGVFADGSLGIINGRFGSIDSKAPNALTVFEAINNISCAMIGIGL